MGYKYKSIMDIMEMINIGDIYLPAIQRNFVWDPWQIESLFDSIMRGYPIGTFIFWYISKAEADKYIFYKFIQNYHDRDNNLNEIAPHPELKDNIIGVLDGQQRLNSMYVALQGTYAYKNPHARWDDDKAFPKRKLYINLFKKEEPTEEETEIDSKEEEQNFLYEFKLLTDNESKEINDNKLWFSVREVLKWEGDPSLNIDRYYDSLLDKEDINKSLKDIIEQRRDQVKQMLRILYRCIVEDKLISYYQVKEQELDDVLDIFIRVNSYGKPLTKTNLLLATIVAIWKDGRDEIESFIKHLNQKGDNSFYFDNDFVMRACLVLTDCPILFKVKGFRADKIEKIRDEWEEIKSAIDKTVDLIVKFGFDGKTLTSQNAIIPIAYYIKKGGDVKGSVDDIKKYLIHALLKQIYGGQGDKVLSDIRDVIGDMIKSDGKFSFNRLLNKKLPGNKSLMMADKEISEILEYEKGPYTFMVLSLLYPNLKFEQVKFHQDHIHPESLFTEAKLKSHGIPQELWGDYISKANKLPNLQLMEGTENEQKNGTTLEEWLNGKDKYGKPYVADVQKFKMDNYIPPEASTNFKDFLDFYNQRKNLLKEHIEKILTQ